MIVLIKKIRTLFFCLLSVPLCASANMTVYPMAVGLDANGEGSVRVISKSPEVQYVRTKVLRITDPATPQEKEVEVSGGSGDELVVMPPMFAIPGGASKRARMVAMDPQEKEVLYRVMFESVPALEDTVNEEKSKGISTELSVNLIWGVLVSVPPRQPVIQLTLSPDKTLLLNKGTQRVKITGISLCRKGQRGEACLRTNENRNLFPDSTYKLPSLKGFEKIEITYKDWIKNKNDSQVFSIN